MFSISKPLFGTLGADCQKNARGGLVLLNKKFSFTKHMALWSIRKYKIFLKVGTQKPLTPGLSSSNQGGTLHQAPVVRGSYLILPKLAKKLLPIFSTLTKHLRSTKVKFSTPLNHRWIQLIIRQRQQPHFLFGYAVSISLLYQHSVPLNFTSISVFINSQKPSFPLPTFDTKSLTFENKCHHC